MRRFIVLVAFAFVLTVGCARTQYRTVRVPPRIDLTDHDIIAVVPFESANEGELGPLVTRRFTDLARRDQGLVRMINAEPGTLKRDPNAFKGVGQSLGAQTLFVGSLEISDVRPNLSLSSTLKSGSLTANVEAMLTVELIETESGASIWSASARATKTIGHITMFDRKNFVFDAENPDEAYGPLIDALVAQVVSDFQATWVRERVVN